MEYKQIAPDIIIRTVDGVKIQSDDPSYMAWLEAGNSPFPPDPPVGEELNELIEAVE